MSPALLMVLAAVLGFVALGGVAVVFVSPGQSRTLKRAHAIADRSRAPVRSRVAAPDPAMRRKQILKTLKAKKVNGVNGGSLTGNNSYTRNPDGSAQGSFNRSARGASGGSYDSSGSYARDASGNWSAERQTSASGARGSYSGSTSGSNGTDTHDSTIHGANGGTYNGQTSYTRGQGVTHTGSCTDAGGAATTCAH